MEKDLETSVNNKTEKTTETSFLKRDNKTTMTTFFKTQENIPEHYIQTEQKGRKWKVGTSISCISL